MYQIDLTGAIYVNRDGTIYLSSTSELECSLKTSPTNSMAGRFSLVHVGDLDLEASIQPRVHSKLVASIKIPPTNFMAGLVDIVEPPKIKVDNAAIRDAFVNSHIPRMNYGVDGDLLVGGWEVNNIYRSFLYFDVSNVPKGMDIISAKLKLYNATEQPGEYPISVYDVEAVWEEYGITWKNQPTLKDKIDTKVVGDSREYLEFDVLSLARRWVEQENTNFGVALVADDETSPYRRFRARELGENPPVLEIVYYDPVIRSYGVLRLMSSLTVKAITDSSITSTITVASHNVDVDLPVKLGVKRTQLDCSIFTIPNRNLHASINVRARWIEDFEASFSTSRPFLDASIQVMLAGFNDLASSITVKANRVEQLISTLNVSQLGIDGSLTVRIPRDLPADMVIRKRSISDIFASLSPRLSAKKDLHSSIIVIGYSVLPATILVISGNLYASIDVVEKSLLPASVIVRQLDDNNFSSVIGVRVVTYYDFDGSVVVRTRMIDDLNCSIEIKVTYKPYAFIMRKRTVR